MEAGGQLHDPGRFNTRERKVLKRLVAPQSWIGRFGEHKNLFPLQGLESQNY